MSKANEFTGIIRNGIIDENPTFRLVLGMCPTLAVSKAVINGIGMGLATTFVLVCSNLLISLLRNFIPAKVRLPAYIVIIATFVTIVDLMMAAFIPSLHSALGMYIQLIVVNCIVMARAESYAAKNPPLHSALDGLGMGLGFTLALCVLSAVRELLGAGSLFGIHVLTESFPAARMINEAPGGFICLAMLMAVVNTVMAKRKKTAEKEEVEA